MSTCKRGKRQVRHSLELQALAIRTGKTYVEHLPELSHHPVELFVDVEGVPDRNSFYLIGLLACAGGEVAYHAFWAGGPEDEARVWGDFIGWVASFPDAPLNHYGSYERKAFRTLERRHGGGRELAGRLVNVASSVYGRVYFPVRSNGLKVLGRFLGATWTYPEASGLMSLVWRHRWEAAREDHYKAALLQYNREDCEAVLQAGPDSGDRHLGADSRFCPPAEADRHRDRQRGAPAVRANLAKRSGGRPAEVRPRPCRGHECRRRAEEERCPERTSGLSTDRPIEGRPDHPAGPQAKVPPGARRTYPR